MNSKQSKRGGARTGAGRKKGEVSKTRLVLQERAKIASTEGQTPLEYMLEVMRTSNDTKRKDAMAQAAAPYVHPRLAAVEHSGDDEKPMTFQIITGVPRAEDDEPYVNGHDSSH